MVDIVDIGLAVDDRDIKKATKSLDGLKKQSKKTETATEKMTSTFKKYATVAAATAAIWKTIEAHRAFSKTISELSAITGAVGMDLKFYREQALLLGTTTTFAASEVAMAFKLVASAKPDLLASKEALASVTREVLTLAEASGLALPEAANALGSALNQFGADAEEANRFINVLAAGAKFGSSEIEDTAQALKNVGAVASSLGVSFEQTNAAIQALASVSIKGAEAGTGLRGVLLKLAKQSKDEFNPEIVGLEQALLNLEAANLSTTEKIKLFGQESITSATALINQAGAVGKLTDSLTGTNTAMEQAATNTDNLDGDIKAMGSSWEGIALILGDIFDPALRFSTQLITGIGKAIQTAVLEIADLGNMLGAYAAIAAAVATLDFDHVSVITAARKAEREELDKKISLLWGEKEAIEAKTEAEMAAAELKTASEIVEEEAGDVTEDVRLIREQELQAAIVIGEVMHNALMEEIKQEAFDKEWERIEIAAQHEDDVIEARIRNMTKLEKFNALSAKKQTKQVLGELSSMTQGVAQHNKTLFEVNKAAAIGNAVMNAWAGASRTMAEYPYPYNIVLAGLSLASGLAQVSAIQSTSFGGGGGGGSISGGSAAPAAPSQVGQPGPLPDSEESTRNVSITLEGRGYSRDDVRELIGQINEEVGDGVTLVAS